MGQVPGSKRTLAAFASGLVASALACAAARVTAPKALEFSPSIEFQGLLAEMPQQRSVVVRNPDYFRVRAVDAVTTSCGCIVVVDRPRSIPPRSSAEIVLEATPRGSAPPSESRLTLVSGGRAQHARLTLEVVPLFEGWPEAARAERLGERACVKLHPAYCSSIEAASYFDADDVEVPAAIRESASGCLIVHPGGAPPHKLAVRFKRLPPFAWAGPVTDPVFERKSR